MPLQLTNNIFFIDRFFFKHLSFFSKSSIFYNSENIEKFFRAITKFGEGYFELSLILILLLFIFLNKKKSRIFKKYIAGIFFTLLSTQITVNLFKLLFGRARPSVTANPEKFYGVLSLIKNNFLFEGDYASFPSGHTITIWGTIWILSFFIKNRYIKTLLFLLAFLYHWTTDVIASIIISYFIAKFVYNKINPQQNRHRYAKKPKEIQKIKRKRESMGLVTYQQK